VLDREIYKAILVKANENTQGILFAGNYLFAYHNSNFVLNRQSTTNLYDIDKVKYVPSAEIGSSEVAFTESNNRSDFTKVYEFAFPHTTVNVPDALQELRDYYFANPNFDVVDGEITYTIVTKVSRPNKSREILDARSGKFIMLYQMQFSMMAYDSTKGYDANKATVTIDSTAVQYQSFVKGTALVTDPSNKVTDEKNTTRKPYAQGVGGTAVFIYDRSTVSKKIFKACDGNVTTQSRDTTFSLLTTVDGIVDTIDIYIWGTYTLAPNNAILMTCTWAEV